MWVNKQVIARLLIYDSFGGSRGLGSYLCFLTEIGPKRPFLHTKVIVCILLKNGDSQLKYDLCIIIFFRNLLLNSNILTSDHKLRLRVKFNPCGLNSERKVERYRHTPHSTTNHSLNSKQEFSSRSEVKGVRKGGQMLVKLAKN